MNGTCASFVLTVSEGKRLIARGVVALDFVQAAWRDGMIAVGKGTTNAYVLEELLGERVDKSRYCLGATLPAGGPSRSEVFHDSDALPEMVFRRGQVVEGLTVAQSVHEMHSGDVVIKGANALNYAAGTAGILVGHPAGGTIGSTIGAVYGRKLRLVIPIGLEKEIVDDINECSAMIQELGPPAGHVPALFPVQGDIITEIEALEILSGAVVRQIGAGGVAGAEGAIWLMALGTEEQVSQAKEIIESMHGEPAFWK